jgi:hypothetical protein
MARGGDSPGHLKPYTSGADANGVSIVPHAGDVAVLARFGRPGSYGLTHAELAAHIRQLRQAGWRDWEVRARFDFSRVA